MRKADVKILEDEKKKLTDNQFEAWIKLDNALEVLNTITEEYGFSCTKMPKEREAEYLMNYGKISTMLYIANTHICDAKKQLEGALA